MGNFKVQPVEVSPEAQLYSFQDENDSSDFEAFPEKLTRADYAVKESPDEVRPRFQSMTEKA